MDSPSTPTTESPRPFDDISITSSTTDEFFDADSFISRPSSGFTTSGTSTSIASYITERTVNSRKSRYNTPPRHKYAGIEHLRPPRGPVSLDVDDASVLQTELRVESDEATKTLEAHRSGPRLVPEYETTIDDIRRVRRFRFLVVGRSAAGRSSLINRAFGIKTVAVHFEDHQPSAPDIQQESQNKDFVLHISEGFKPRDLSNFVTVHSFLEQRSRPELPLSDRIHGIWLCAETPTAGGNVFETGDEMLLHFSHQIQVPIVIVFTQYDRLVKSKRGELRDDYPMMDNNTLDSRSVEEAGKAFESCLQSVGRTMHRLGIPMPPHARLSARLGFEEEISELLLVIRNAVKERLEDSAWASWTIPQRASLLAKIDACVIKGVNYYTRTLTGRAPELRQLLLRDCLGIVHRDIISCWDFKGEVLNSPEFQQLMLRLVQDVHTKPTAAILPDVDTISQFVTLVTAAPASILPPVAILGTTYVFVRWFSTAVLENEPLVQRLLIAYTVDLIGILRELFGITLKSKQGAELALRTTWTELQAALVAYERSFSRQRIHNSICSKLPLNGPILTIDGISRMVRELLQDSPKRS